METITHEITLEPGVSHINLIPIGDIHLGDISCDLNYLKATIEYVLEGKNRYTILMGDAINAVVHSDAKRYDPTTIDPRFPTIQDEYREIKRLFKPLADEGKILANLEGNHESAALKHLHYDYTKALCEDLNIPYGSFSCFLKLKLNTTSESGEIKRRTAPVIFATHGTGFASRVGGRINRIEDLMRYISADAYLMGHNHQIAAIPMVQLRMDQFGNLEQKKILLVNTGSFLNSFKNKSTSYAERKGYGPLKVGVVNIRIDAMRKDFHASI